jgi:endo-1,4-beta-xylanase
MHLRGSSMYFAVVGLSSTSAVLAAVAPYGQCGGNGFSGETSCSDGWSCNKVNDWYSQCVQGAAAVAPAAPVNNAPAAPATTAAAAKPTKACSAKSKTVQPTKACSAKGKPTTMATIVVTPTPAAAAKPAAQPANVKGTGANGAKCNINAAFQAKGKKYIGIATDGNTIGKPAIKSLMVANFGQVTPENSMKWDATEGTEGKLNLNGANTLVDFATQNKMLIRGHTTVWHSQLPAWVSQIKDKAKLEAAMVGHITRLMTAYKGKVYAWDVVNEIFNEDGSFRPSVFYNVLGEGFVATAFKAAKKADPNAKLYINDYNLDTASYAKTKAMAAKVKQWIAAGVPIDGIGSQSHLGGPWPIAEYPGALKSLCAAAPECAITELDIKGASANDYKTAIGACLDIKNCVGVTVWGVSDTDSWRKSENPLLFNSQNQAKESYNAVCSLLGA